MGKTYKQNDRHFHKDGRKFVKTNKTNKHQSSKKWKIVDDDYARGQS